MDKDIAVESALAVGRMPCTVYPRPLARSLVTIETLRLIGP
jgi:hypothetical protein